MPYTDPHFEAQSACRSSIDPRAATLMLCGFLSTVLWLPADGRLLLPAGILVALAVCARQLRALLSKLRLVLSMLLLFGVFVAVRKQGTEVWGTVFGMDFYREAIVMATEMTTRLLLVAAASLLYILTVPITAIVAALRYAHVPDRLISVIWMTDRLLILLGQDARRSLDCMHARAAQLSLASRIMAAARLSGTSLLRAVGRSEQLADALAARGFTGEIPVLQNLHWRRNDTTWLLVGVASCTMLWIV